MPVHFSALIKRVRLEKRMTQHMFAAFIGVPRNTYKNWERYICLPNFRHLELLQNKLGAHVDELEAAYMDGKM